MTPREQCVDDRLLAAHPLPSPSGDQGKHDRGTALIVGATTETPGALLLAGLAALRVGAGRLQVAAPEAVATALATQLPEAQVIGLRVHPSGTVAPCSRLADAMAQADAVLIGSGLGDEDAGLALLEAAVSAMVDTTGQLVVDAGALLPLGSEPHLVAPMAERAVAIPNVGEAAALLGDDRASDEPRAAAEELVQRLGCTVALRGPETWITAPGQPPAVERDGPVALATSGSGDVLAGMATGHLARGAAPFASALWAVHLHALAGRELARDGNEIGLLARELLDAVPIVRAVASAIGGV